MAIEKVNIQTFLELASKRPVLDARSPGEFVHAHFPGAFNVPLFSDEERKVVGTAYKQKSREDAIKIGLDYFGSKMRKIVEDVETLVNHWTSSEMHGDVSVQEPLSLAGMATWGHDVINPSRTIIDSLAARSRQGEGVLVHCWRGGMRSTAIAWLLDLYGFKVYLLEGGYKRFRHYVQDTFKTPLNCKILGGFTGSGKTPILKELSGQGFKVVDLEGLANHKGSAFGSMGPQPSQEMFENMLALKLRDSFEPDSNSTSDSIWFEDESQRIGTVIIPQDLWEQMRKSPIYFLDIPFEERLNNIMLEYGEVSKQDLIEAILRIQRRLGGLETKNAIAFLMEKNIRESFRILLSYYDKSYLKSFLKRPAIVALSKDITCETVDVRENARKLIDAISSKQQLSFK